ncbi:MAG: TonB-dependent receptor plug domain-containing protein [Candidatus Brocadiia bacterium]
MAIARAACRPAFPLLVLAFLAGLAGAGEAPGPPEEREEEATEDQEPRRLPEVVVTATRRETLLSDTPDVVQVVTRREIEELKPRSTGELLEYVTGATVETGTGSGQPKRSVIGLNGLPPNYTLVLVDGVRLLSEHIHTGQNIELIPPQSIERIEIIRGAAAAQYGSDAIGGVVNIITRKCGPTPELSLEGAGGSYDTYRGGLTVFRPLAEGLRLSLFSYRDQSHGVPLEAPEHRIGEMGYERLINLVRLDYDVTETSKVFAWVNRSDDTMDWLGEEADSYLMTSVLGARTQLSPTLELFTQVAYSKWDAEVSAECNKLLQPETHVRWSISEAHALTLGVDLKHHDFSRSAAEAAPDQDTYGAFAQHEWRLGDQLTLMTALRYDDVEDMESELTPKVSLVYSPDLPLRLRASVARGFRAPTPQELYERGYGHGGRAFRFGNPDLEPEHSTTAALGIELFPGEPFEVMLYGHYSDIDDMIVPVYEGPWAVDPTKDVWRRTNIEKAEVYGAEMKARYTFSPNFRLEGGGSYTSNEDQETGRQLPYDPGYSAFLKAVAEGPLGPNWRWSAFAGLRAVFNRSAWSWKPAPGTDPSDPSGLTTELEDYEKVSAGLSLRYKDRYELFLNAYNLLAQDIENLDDIHTIIDGEPTFMVGFRATW